jgi:hypothetical protein
VAAVDTATRRRTPWLLGIGIALLSIWIGLFQATGLLDFYPRPSPVQRGPQPTMPRSNRPLRTRSVRVPPRSI